MNRDRDTLPPTADEIDELRAFEHSIQEHGEDVARLRRVSALLPLARHHGDAANGQ